MQYNGPGRRRAHALHASHTYTHACERTRMRHTHTGRRTDRIRYMPQDTDTTASNICDGSVNTCTIGEWGEIVDDYVHGMFQCDCMRLQSAARCGDYPFLSNENNTRRNRRGLDRNRRRCSLDQSHRATNRSLRPVLVYRWRKTG